MKKILFLFLAIFGFGHLMAQSPYLDPAIQEDLFPTGQAWYNTKRFLSHSCANAYGNHYNLNAQINTDVYTYSWDEWDNHFIIPLHMGGFAIREFATGTQILSGATAVAEKYYNLSDTSIIGSDGYTVSIEASFVKDILLPNRDYVAVTYYRYSPHLSQYGYFLELFSWNGIALVSLGITPLSDPYFGPLGKGIIHHDFQQNSESMILTFEANGRIYTQSLRIALGAPKLSGLGELTIGFPVTRPDVAMSILANGSTDLSYVVNSSNNQNLYVFGTDLATIDAIPIGPTPTVVAVTTKDAVTVWDLIGTPPGVVEFDIPRIDAPDISPSGEETWSWVVSEQGSDKDYVRSGYFNGSISGTVRYDYLNTTINFPTFDISQNIGNNESTINQRAVVAFGNDEDVYYAWVRRENNAFAPLYSVGGTPSTTGYVSHKLDKYGNCLNNFPTLPPYNIYNGYDKINDDPYNPGMMASVALATATNDYLFGLFSSFVLEDPSVTYSYGFQIGNKTTDWNTAQFRPTNSDQSIKNGKFTFTASPNPFTQGISLDFRGTINNSDILSLDITNIMGQTILEAKGEANFLNTLTQSKSATWTSGLYLIRIIGSNGMMVRKVVKQ